MLQETVEQERGEKEVSVIEETTRWCDPERRKEPRPSLARSAASLRLSTASLRGVAAVAASWLSIRSAFIRGEEGVGR